MSIVNKVLTMFLGNKEERDLKEINPFVGKILKESELVSPLTNDQLRDRTAELKKEIRESSLRNRTR
jgi:preprotein translocase subunit SecA